MELQTINQPEVALPPFIIANTVESNFYDLEFKHIIPVFAKDNEVAISHVDFITAVHEAVHKAFTGHTIELPEIRVSHPVHGRIPEARDKKPAELLSHEKTLYYERMMFTMRVPSITKSIGGKSVALTIGGVKSYHWDKLSGKCSAQTFKVFVGFQVYVCSNLCVAADGGVLDVATDDVDVISKHAYRLLSGFNYHAFAEQLQQLEEQLLSKDEFATFIGRVRMGYYNPTMDSKQWLGDQQMAKVVKGYYKDPDFKAHANGEISLWNLYNLMTRANQGSYIDTMLERSVSALEMLSI